MKLREKEYNELKILNSQKYKLQFIPLGDLGFSQKKQFQMYKRKSKKKTFLEKTIICDERRNIRKNTKARSNIFKKIENYSSSSLIEKNLPLSRFNLGRVAKMKGNKRGGCIERSLSIKESIESFQTPGMLTKYKKNKKIEDIHLNDYECLKLKINEEIEFENIQNTNFAENSLIFSTIKKKDFEIGKIEFHNFSGLDVCPNQKFQWGVQHINKMMKPMNSVNQNYLIWLQGMIGLLKIWHNALYRFILGSIFEFSMNFCVIANTTVLAMDNLFDDPNSNKILTDFNFAFTIIFIIEMTIKLIALGPRGYVQEKMNIFDGSIVTISIIELAFTSGNSSSISAIRGVRILRTFRVLRVTRLLRSLSFMKIIINVLSKALSDFIYIAILLVLFIFIYSLLGMQLYNNKLNFSDADTRMNFDDFNSAFLTVFQLLTVENWQQILHTVLRTDLGALISVFYLISWIFIGNYVFLNLFLTILLDGFTNEQEELDEVDDHLELLKEPEIEHFLEIENQILTLKNEYETEIFDEENMEYLRSFTEVKKEGVYENVYCHDSLYIFSKSNYLRSFCIRIVRSNQFENIILIVILGSSLKLCIDTYLDDNDTTIHKTSSNIDLLFTLFFLLEATIKIIAFGYYFDKGSYLRETWNQLDFFIVFSSIVDLAFDNINLPVVKVLRLLRTLRPLRFISHNINLKIVVTALLESVSAIFNVAIVVFLIWLMFGILGMSLLSQKMYKCNIAEYFGVSKTKCLSSGYEWILIQPNFSNIINSMITLFILSTQEGWPDIMLLVIDSNGDDGPIKNSNPYMAYFIIIFILVGTLFLMNLFVGVIFYNFMKAQKSEQASLFLTPEQQHWIDIMKKIPNARSDFMKIKPPKNKLRMLLYTVINKNAFETFIMASIILNIIAMAMDYEGDSDNYSRILEYINDGFTGIFIFEAILKLIAYGFRGYWYSRWNRFDAFVVLTSIIDILMSQAGQSFITFMKSGTQLARVFRVLRVTRLLKLIKSLEGLQRILETLIITLPSLMNVGGLLLLVFFIYAVLGVNLFKEIRQGDAIDDWNNFQNFGSALLILFRCSTGEDWYKIMFDLYNPTPSNCPQGNNCGNIFAPLYFLSFILICTFIMLNLFILIIIQQFEERAESATNLSEDYKDHLNNFKKVWSIYSTNSKGLKINQKYLIDLMKLLKPPIGFSNSIPRYVIAKDIMKMNIKGDEDGNVYFNELLFAVMKRGLALPILKNVRKEIQILLNNVEFTAKKKILKITNKCIKKKTINFNIGFRTLTTFAHPPNPVLIKLNPMFKLLLLNMIYLSWSKFSKIIMEGTKKNPDFMKSYLNENTLSDSGTEYSGEEYYDSELSDIEESNQDEFSDDEEKLKE